MEHWGPHPRSGSTGVPRCTVLGALLAASRGATGPALHQLLLLPRRHAHALQGSRGPRVPRGGTGHRHRSQTQPLISKLRRQNGAAVWWAETPPTLGPGCAPGLPVTWTVVWHGLGRLWMSASESIPMTSQWRLQGRKGAGGRAGSRARGQNPRGGQRAEMSYCFSPRFLMILGTSFYCAAQQTRTFPTRTAFLH